MDVRNVLVLRGGALGDFIVTLPALAALRRAYPRAGIELIGNAFAAALAENRGLLTRVYSQHEARWAALYGDGALTAELHEWLGHFDLVINYWPDNDGALAGRFPVRRGQQFLSAVANPQRTPASAHYCAALEPLGIRATEHWHQLKPLTGPRPAVVERAGTSRSNEYKPIAIHPGSGSRTKNWPADRWIELIARTADPVVLILGAAELETWSRERLASMGLATRLANGSLELAEQWPLEALVDCITRCRGFVGHDSGVSHLAAATGTPCLLLFGPTDPKMWAPPAPQVRVIQHGNDLRAITVDEVLDAFK